MIKPEKHIKEEERIKALESYSILDSLPEVDYQNLSMIASQICETPIALIGFIDKERQWMKSSIGLDIVSNLRDFTFCGHAINDPNDMMIIPDARVDVRFQDNPSVIGQPNIVFYAGIPLKNNDGLPLGTICVLDHKPKILSPDQIESLKALSEQVMRLLELRLNKLQLEKSLIELEKKNVALEKFAYIAAHDLKSPLANISGLTDFFADSYDKILDDEGKEIINLVKNSSTKLKEMIDSLLEFTKANVLERENDTEISIIALQKEISDLFAFQSNCTITFQSNINFLVGNKTAIEQILINLVTNAIKYNDKNNIEIIIEIQKIMNQYQISVSDNGRGISKEHHAIIFEVFEVVGDLDRFGVKGTGIGLATVKNLVETLNGQISVVSEMGVGSTFKVTIPS